MSPLRVLALVAALLLLVPFGWFRNSTTPVDGGTRNEITLGLPCSPWFIRTRQEVRHAIGPTTEGTARNTTTSMTWSTHVELLTWSFLAFVGTIVLLQMACHRRRPPPAP